MSSQNSKHDIGKVLTHYGFDIPVGRAGWITIRCAFHNDKVKSARLNLENGGFRCFACDMAGDVYSIIMKKEGVKYGEAVKIAERITGEVHGKVRTEPRQGDGLPSESRYNKRNRGFVPSRIRG